MSANKQRCSFRLKCPPWNFIVSVSWGERGWLSYRRSVLQSGGHDVGMEPDEDNKGECWGTSVWVLEFDDAILVHELHHVATRAMEFVSVDDEECEAYLQSWLYGKVMKRWGRM